MPEGLERGQTSFEMIVVATIAMAIVVSSLAMVPWLTNSTGKIAVVKNDLLTRFSKQEEFSYILNVENPNTGTSPQEITVLYGGKELSASTAAQWEKDIAKELADKNFYSDSSQVKIKLVHQ